MWLISRGHTSKTLDDISHEDLAVLRDYHFRGRIGLRGEAAVDYLNISYLHAIIVTIRNAVGDKKRMPVPPFNEIMPGWVEEVKKKPEGGMEAFFDSIDMAVDQDATVRDQH